MTKQKKSNLLAIVLGAVAVALIAGIYVWTLCFGKNFFSNNNSETIQFAVPTGSSVSDIATKLDTSLQVRHLAGFMLLANVLDLENHVYGGMYEFPQGASSWDVVRLFRSGRRVSVKFTLSFARTYNDVLKLASEKLEANYDELVELAENKAFLDSLGFNKYTLACLFIPDTYDFYWNTSARKFYERMAKEYHTYWNENRVKQAKLIGFTPMEIATIASIVNQETRQNADKPRIAGVYINRLRSNATAGKLQADPTIKFALQDFEIKRVRKGHIERASSSPYSTYAHRGLPPGPICTPSKIDIQAVLNYAKHNYLYFCAKPDYSGFSNFSATFDQHRKFAREYQAWLNSEGF